MMIPFDPTELWTDAGGSPPPVITDDARARRRRYIGSLSIAFLSLIPRVLLNG